MREERVGLSLADLNHSFFGLSLAASNFEPVQMMCNWQSDFFRGWQVRGGGWVGCGCPCGPCLFFFGCQASLDLHQGLHQWAELLIIFVLLDVNGGVWALIVLWWRVVEAVLDRMDVCKCRKALSRSWCGWPGRCILVVESGDVFPSPLHIIVK